jgi:hypothetical protein
VALYHYSVASEIHRSVTFVLHHTGCNTIWLFSTKVSAKAAEAPRSDHCDDSAAGIILKRLMVLKAGSRRQKAAKPDAKWSIDHKRWVADFCIIHRFLLNLQPSSH